MKSLQVLQGSYYPLTSATALLREPGSNWWPRGYDSHALPTELSRNEKTGATGGFGRRAACPEGQFLLHGFQDRSVRSNRFLRHPVEKSKSNSRRRSAGYAEDPHFRGYFECCSKALVARSNCPLRHLARISRKPESSVDATPQSSARTCTAASV